jgi:hypothetical protein
VDLQLLKDSKASSRLAALILLVPGFGIFLTLLGILLSIPFIDGSFVDVMTEMSAMTTEQHVHLMKYYQIVTQFAWFLVPALIFGSLVQKNVFEFFNMNQFPTLLFVVMGILIIFLSNPFNEWLVYQNNQLNLPPFLSDWETWMREAEEAAAIATNKFLEMDSFNEYLLNIFMIGVMAALGEELLFRGAAQPLMMKLFKNPHIGIWSVAIIFSIIHFQFYGFFARMFLGAILGYSYYFTKNLWIPIIAHFFNNSMAVTYVYLSKEPLYNTSQGIIEVENVNTLYALLSLSFVILGLFIMRYYATKSGIKYHVE